MTTHKPSAPSRNNGFALLGTTKRKMATNLNWFANALAIRQTYDVVNVGIEYWIRDKTFGALKPRLPVKQVLCMTGSTINREAINNLVLEFESNLYGKHFYEGEVYASIDDIRKELNNPDLSIVSPTGWNRLTKAVFHAAKGQLATVLAEMVLPCFFRWFPKGCARIYLMDPAWEDRFSVLRVARVSANFDILDLDSEIPQSLSRWQFDYAPSIFDMITEWGSLLVFPKVTGMLFSTLGLSVQVIDDALGAYHPPDIPVSLLDLKHGKSQFGEEDADMTFTNGGIRVKNTSFYGRYCWPEKVDNSKALADFIADSANTLIQRLGNITNYERYIEGLVQIDLTLAQEQLWTIGRIVRRTLSLQSCESRWINRLAVFEVADQWGKLMHVWGLGGEVDNFKLLLHPEKGAYLVKDCLSSMPDPWRTRFENVCSDVYQMILRDVRESVWSKKKSDANGVNLGTNASPKVEPWADFTAKVLRDLRNTHHGYMPDKKDTRSRLVLTTGEWSPAMTFLPSLWLMAFLCDPKKFIGWKTR